MKQYNHGDKIVLKSRDQLLDEGWEKSWEGKKRALSHPKFGNGLYRFIIQYGTLGQKFSIRLTDANCGFDGVLNGGDGHWRWKVSMEQFIPFLAALDASCITNHGTHTCRYNTDFGFGKIHCDEPGCPNSISKFGEKSAAAGR
jgi:hypothetical protein